MPPEGIGNREPGAATRIDRTSGAWWRPFREIDGIAIVYVDLSPNAAWEAEALGWLCETEQARRERTAHIETSRRYVLCRAALRALLCGLLRCNNWELAFGHGEFGKPFALVGGVPAAINFNVSHSGRHGLIAIALQGRVGVDVEELVMPQGLNRLIASAFTAAEKADLKSGEPTNRIRDFFRLWTAKEALIKALGKGLSIDLSTFEIPIEMRRGAKASVFKFPDSPETLWRLVNLSTRDFAAAVTYESGRQDDDLHRMDSGKVVCTVGAS